MALVVSACASGPKKAPAASSATKAPVAPPGVKIGKPYAVFGKTYVPGDDRAYDEVGIASWYGPTFHAKPTANGETYNQDDVTAAHKTLPMPSWVEVHNLDNGRKLTVRINDRGPFVDGRIIDLSRRSAQLLGVDRPGLARVRVRRVFPEGDWARVTPPMLPGQRPAQVQVASTAPANRAAAPAATAATQPAGVPIQAGGVPASLAMAAALPAPAIAPAPSRAENPVAGSFIQVAALSDEGRARALASVLSDYGPSAAVPAPGGLWRVRIGPVPADRFDALLWEVRAAGYADARPARW
ncbi:septal ring lytic transglycosylase RlpA family protein [Sandaracinobacteroides sp. A072]|uniref:septal ring lytic transglycosylase RlpA family protein n=1 Tax=Sandaracinobacteroides sp. A072 TaxID=3461146 RepID=UPI004042FB03